VLKSEASAWSTPSLLASAASCQRGCSRESDESEDCAFVLCNVACYAIVTFSYSGTSSTKPSESGAQGRFNH